ncbi:type 2 isopentenyl-diphosphate Delta-isomerase [Sansalvadorimonas sp. 2012CJ34-2]|uniref:Isopentenyl-diphosphate delta-isomerase n=1 Tax=Parendozoicomonas callyspongiae TaxID=2942213 RepID=A0ABT0PIG3_9GAMM|nr:type 2 isopentenyl-diphosphate Delta-isomerase [Sansalvadorimonas sp. 2012CJ34-2]MCL6270806.1 type 2 isopentenyl-diphosphate Delta-isomerase [Sansalvadorimonas sp. 2012CJ34-2]
MSAESPTPEAEGHLTNSRKVEHIQLIEQDRETDRDARYFDRIRLTHRAFPEINLDDVDPSVEFMGKKLSFPLLISSMTGGDHALVRTINYNLAVAAQETGVAMGVGSQRVMFEQSSARASFAIRQHAPDALLFANLGAVQLNKGFGIEQCREAVELVGADALYLHLNALQEAIQPEGDTEFRGLLDRIEEIRQQLEVPLLLKEVGCGFSQEDIAAAVSRGIKYIDVAGQGGTSWSRIEHHRADDLMNPGILFQDWGIPTPRALKLAAPYQNRIELIASGGLRNGVDMAKSVILGARLCGLAAPLLKPAMESVDRVITVIEALKREFVTTMFLLGAPDVAALHGNERLILDDFS